MQRRSLFLVSLLGLTLTATAQEKTAREYAEAHGISNRQSPITLSVPHACTLSKQHPCVYYGGDIDPNDPQEDGLANWNGPTLPDLWTYEEVNVPTPLKISAAFTNNLQTYGIIDPKTANWNFRIGVSEGNGGTDIGSGTAPAVLTATGRNAFGLVEYELLTKTPQSIPKGNVWFDVQPICTNHSDPACNNGQYFESDTDGLNGINSKFTVTSNDGMGPTLFCIDFYCGNFFSWCNDEGVACGDGMSAGLLK